MGPRKEDVLTFQEMQRTGGSFVRALGLAAAHADADNLARIKAAFPEYWTEYHRRAMQRDAEGGE